MPVTIKLSKFFHERLGEELANELKFARFDAKLERRLGERTRWLVVTWATLLIPIVGLWLRG